MFCPNCLICGWILLEKENYGELKLQGVRVLVGQNGRIEGQNSCNGKGMSKCKGYIAYYNETEIASNIAAKS